jgi:hypothetical protein
MYMIEHNNRLQFVDAEDGTIWYTKTFVKGNGLAPSGFLTQQIDSKLGASVALAEMDDKLVVFKERGFAVQSGDGANDSGTGSTLTSFQFVPSDVGCSGAKSVVTTPNGVMFKSANGIYLLNRAVGVSYVGAEVEAYNSQTITSAILIPGKTQVRFLCSSGKTLVFDYMVGQWATFTNHTGVSSARGIAPMSTLPGRYPSRVGELCIYRRRHGYSLLAETSWLSLAGIQGFQRIKRLAILGDFANGGIRISRTLCVGSL